ncbi:hypothetical protein Avbf_18194, partial [Armadillidium vulgare]
MLCIRSFIENNSKKKTKDKKRRKRKRNRRNNSKVLSSNSKFKKDNYAEAKDNSQFGTYEDLSSISNIEDAKLRDAHSSPMDNSQIGMYDQLSSTSNNEKDKLRDAHKSPTVASFQENLTEHSSEKTDSTKEKNKSVEGSADYAEYQKCYEDSKIIYSEKGEDQIMKELNQIKSENRYLSSQIQKLLISHELILSSLHKMMKQVFIIEESNAQPIDEKELLNSNVNFQNYDEISPIILTSTGEDNCARSDATAIIPSVFSIKGLNSQSIDKENYPVQSDAQD